MRRDAFGFVWQDIPKAEQPKATKEKKARAPTGPRPIPPYDSASWKPKEFPRLEAATMIALDTETKDLDLETKGPGVRRDGHLVGISVAVPDGQSWYFPMRHEVGAEQNLPPENVIAWAKDQLTRPGQPKIGANLLYDTDYLAEEGVDVAGPFYDVQVAESLIDENRFTYNLNVLSNDYLGHGKNSDALETWVRSAYGVKKDFRENIYRAPPCLVGPYAESDASNPMEIYAKQVKILEAENLLPLWEIESGLHEPLLAMRRRGVRVSMKKAQQVEDELEQNIARDKEKLNALAGFEVGVDTKEHLIRLFDARGYAYPRTAPTRKFPNGQPSFTKEFLTGQTSPEAQLINDIRKWQKFLGTFIRGYIYDMHVNGRIHCLFNQAKGDDYGTVSGRFSSSLPNLQNIPARDDYWGPLIRSIFLPELGEDWGKLDWSQIEFRIVTDHGKGPSADRARELYRNDPTTDFHLMVAELTGVGRKPAKNINFGLVYGMGEELLAAQLGIPLEKARELFAQYHERLPFIREAARAMADLANDQGYILTLMNRRRRFHLWQSRRPARDEWNLALPQNAAIAKWGIQLKRAFTHKSLNGYVQGSAADLMKKALFLYWKSKITSVLGAPLLTVHDELDFSVPKNKAGREALREVKHLMENTIQLSIPVLAELSTGANWGAAK